MFQNIPAGAIVIAVTIVSFQFVLFFRSLQKTKILRYLFPSKDTLAKLRFIKVENVEEEVGYTELFLPAGAGDESDYTLFQEVIRKTNRYLERSAGNVVDYELIKEIAESEYDKIINDIELSLPRPLYIGLMGTFLGVILGISEIIGVGELDTNNLSAIIPFLAHIVTAMVASLVGLALTSISTNRIFKVALREADHNKTEYLNEIKYELLPKLNKGVSDILNQVAKSLNKFNKSFTLNVEHFKTVFDSADANISKQLEFVQRFERLRIDSTLQNIDSIVQRIIKANEIFENFGKIAEKLDHSAKAYEALIEKSRSVMDELGVYRDGVQALLTVTETYKSNSSTLKEAAHFFDSQHALMNQVLEKFQNGLSSLIEGYNTDLDKKQLSLIEKRDDLLRHFDIAMEQLREDIPAGKLAKLDQIDKMYEVISKLYETAMVNAQQNSQKLNSEVIAELQKQGSRIEGKLTELSKKLERREQVPGGHRPPQPPLPPPPPPTSSGPWLMAIRNFFKMNKDNSTRSK